MDIDYIRKIMKLHSKTIKHVAHQIYTDERRLYYFFQKKRKLKPNELHRLSRYIEDLENTELFREV